MNRQIILFIIMGSACSDKAITIHNPAPEAVFTSHEMGDVLLEGSLQSFSAALTDANHDSSELIASWVMNDVEICPYTSPDDMGNSICEVVIEAAMNEVKVEVRDPKNALGMSTLEFVVAETDAPEVTIISPTSEALYFSNVPINLKGVSTDTEDSADELSVRWFSDSDEDLVLSHNLDSNGESNHSLIVPQGVHTLTFEATDTSGKMATASLEILVDTDNESPQCEITTPQDGFATGLGQLIMFMGFAMDSEDNASELSVDWSSNIDGVFGVSTPNSDGSFVLNFADLSEGDHEVSITVTDNDDLSCTDTITVAIQTCSPTQTEIPYDGLDSNCDGLEDSEIECAGQLFTTGAGDVYYLFCDHQLYWDKGDEFCKDSGYDALATVANADENQALVSLIQSTDETLNSNLPNVGFASNTFLGFTRYDSFASGGPEWDFGYEWLDAGPVDYVNWKAGEPNDTGTLSGEACVEFIYNSSFLGQWNDVWCSSGEPPNPSWATARRISCVIRP